MSQNNHSRWPFFDESHRELHDRLEAWTASSVPSSLIDDHTDLLKQARECVTLLAEAKWLRYAVPKAFGGIHERLDVRSLCLIREGLAQCSSLLEFSFAMQGLGSGPISLFGDEKLQNYYLPKVASGEKIAALAMSEAEAGSDVSALATTAVKDGESYVLNGEKTWISNAGIADFYVVFARTGEAAGAKGLSAFVVDSDAPGFEVSAQIETISPHPLGTIVMKDCRIPATHLLSNPGEGFKVAMATLDVFRSTVGAAALGFARRALSETLNHTENRMLFGDTLASLQMTQQKLADMATEIDASALLVYRAAWLKDSGQPRISKEASMAKMYSTEAAQRVIDQAVQLFGGKGVVSGATVERLYRDIRPLRIYEGATEVQKIVIARSLSS